MASKLDYLKRYMGPPAGAETDEAPRKRRRKKPPQTVAAPLKRSVEEPSQTETVRGEDPVVLGRDAETIFRDKRGRRMEMLEEYMRQKEGRTKHDEGEDMEWGKGLVQKKQKEDEIARLEKEKNAPFARYRDDEEINQEQRETDRWGDPMLKYMMKKKEKKSKKRKQPVYAGPPPPPNRFNIMPGHRWDGVDRSNGFEKTYFESLSQKKASQTDAYRWSTAEM
mmetsp:Transcript_46615/g.117396  ORF Transcript_46615/g.117396 Transcript_46615/m.117396 type:complete len:223 (+) Transcript_46615:131-799(+)|eukprot:CAMPEP_0177655138 /NCGR_PEP_ID=MMETSP0447-20121125/14774_1 /TAXON_ID=0 /ORGANISM="Stygamoeba regulata, Strain BSH-02190019" /LENGTH=222 /DNA_ID=CAMNT_0019158971 /DNA_START=108 /DNA_END=776 /DNA_ORIENTATION=+